MNWRIFKHPSAKYQVLGAFKGASLVAEVVWCVERRHGGLIGYIMELLHRQTELLAAEAALSAALSEMSEAKVDAVLAWNAGHSPNARAFRSQGFLPLPERLRPIHIFWGGRSFNPDLVSVVQERKNWYVSYVDSDTT
jgi:hypothetical protein